jgi:hypothetical protein
MANAKHFEEVQERNIANTSPLYESQVADLFALFPSKPPLAGEVYLTRAGRRMEDIEVCEAGQPLDLAVVWTTDAAKPEIEVDDDGGRRALKLRAGGQLKLSFPEPITRRLQVSSAGYLKSYTIHAVEPFCAEELPDFARLIQSLADNPPQWTESTFSEFRGRLEKVLSRKEIPSVFAEGIMEYHLGLFYEEQKMPSFRERLQAAYGCLRWFVPYSDVARLICTYFLYCANEFEAADKLCKGRQARLRGAVSFFLGRETARTEPIEAGTRGGAGLPLLVALADLMTFQAIGALASGRSEDALELASVARRHTVANFDKERAARVAYLDARAKAALGDEAGSRSVFESLQHSPWQSIATAANKHLAQSHHG